MRILVRLALLCAAVLSLASVAMAGDRPEKPAKPDKGKVEKPEKGQKDKPGKGDDDAAGDDATEDASGDDAASSDGAGDDDTDGAGADAPARTTVPASPELEYPEEPSHPELTTFAEELGAAPASGTIRVKLPGSDDFTPLAADQALPVGSVVDATRGLVEIMAEAAPDGTEQNAVVTGGVFRLGQDRASGVTELKLQGGDFSNCRTAGEDQDDDSSAVVARAAKRSKSKGGQVSRGIWAAGKGRFRTSGRHSAATVRGTRWATVDRCHSTTTKVWEGIVDVKDFGSGRTVAVRAGERHVARERRG